MKCYLHGLEALIDGCRECGDNSVKQYKELEAELKSTQKLLESHIKMLEVYKHKNNQLEAQLKKAIEQINHIVDVN